jgi:hypothetical protein
MGPNSLPCPLEEWEGAMTDGEGVDEREGSMTGAESGSL